MKLNNKGFAISSIMYIILVLGVILMVVTLALLGGRKLVLDRLKGEAISGIYNEEMIKHICKLSSDSTKTGTEIGAKYNCEVAEGKFYNFYVLSNNEDGMINLILDRNIQANGSLANMVQIGRVEWTSNQDYGCGTYGDNCAKNDKGPITAMKHIYNATKNWTNIDPLTYKYVENSYYGYYSFESTNGIGIITSNSREETVTIGTEDEPLRARMPIYSTYSSETEVKSCDGTNLYLYDYLEFYDWVAPSSKPTNPEGGIYGYWALSSTGENTYYYGYLVKGDGTVSADNVYVANKYGVRPVITIPISKLS